MFFNDLTVIDWGHHLINVLIMGIIAECWEWGKGVNATCFIMNGVPGGIDYMLLTLVKHGLMNSMTEKRLNTMLNMVIRFPGMVWRFPSFSNDLIDDVPSVSQTIVAYVMFICKWHGILHVPWYVIWVHAAPAAQMPVQYGNIRTLQVAGGNHCRAGVGQCCMYTYSQALSGEAVRLTLASFAAVLCAAGGRQLLCSVARECINNTQGRRLQHG